MFRTGTIRTRVKLYIYVICVCLLLILFALSRLHSAGQKTTEFIPNSFSWTAWIDFTFVVENIDQLASHKNMKQIIIDLSSPLMPDRDYKTYVYALRYDTPVEIVSVASVRLVGLTTVDFIPNSESALAALDSVWTESLFRKLAIDSMAGKYKSIPNGRLSYKPAVPDYVKNDFITALNSAYYIHNQKTSTAIYIDWYNIFYITIILAMMILIMSQLLRYKKYSKHISLHQNKDMICIKCNYSPGTINSDKCPECGKMLVKIG